MWSTRMLKKPWIWPVCKSIARTLFAPAVVSKSATNFAVIASRPEVFLSCLA